MGFDFFNFDKGGIKEATPAQQEDYTFGESKNSSIGHPHEVQHYQLQPLFEKAVEIINTVAGCLILFAVIFAGLNLILSFWNCATGSEIKIINPLHQMVKPETATIGRVRLMLGEHTALALGVLVAAGCFHLTSLSITCDLQL